MTESLGTVVFRDLCHSVGQTWPSGPEHLEKRMLEDERCCGTGTCIINAEGYCWCGQKWDGEKMCFPDRTETAPSDVSAQPIAPASDQSD